jgi:phenylpropionate dioxygenase-like ring-hydroxylating dioxygenase large terminal subunit
VAEPVTTTRAGDGLLTEEVRTVLGQLGPSRSVEPGDALGLPPACYTSPEFYEFEKEAVFRRSWVCVGRADQVPKAGDYLSIEIAGEPLVLIRGDDGEVRVLSPICRHRGNSVLMEERGNCGPVLRCPYHYWSYAHDGRLVSAPEMGNGDDLSALRREVRLPQVRTELWQGFVFVNFDPDAEPLAPTLGKLDPVIAPYHVEEMRTANTQVVPDLPWNWKILQENFVEPYHVTYLHQGNHDFAPSRLTEFVPFEDGDGQIMRHAGFLHLDGSLNAEGWGFPGLFPVIETLSEVERGRITWAMLPPTLFMGLAPDLVLFYLLLPTSPGTMTLRINFCFPPDRLELPDLTDRCQSILDGARTIVDQDFAVNTAVQRNLASRFAPRPRYSKMERTLTQFNRWLTNHYLAAADGGAR